MLAATRAFLQRHDAAMFVVLFLGGCLVLAPLMWLPVNTYDEGIILTGAARLAAGEIPYRDFWGLYPPGQFQVLAWLFQTFGQELWISRAFDVVVKALLAIAVGTLISLAGKGRKPAIWAWIAALFWIGYRDAANYPVFAALLLVVTSQILLLWHLQKAGRNAQDNVADGPAGTGWRQHLMLLASALALVTAALFRIDLAALAGLAMLIVVLLHQRHFPARHPVTVIPYGIYTVSAALVALGYLHLRIGLPVLFEQLIAAPATLIPQFRALPYPSFGFGAKQLPFYLVPATLACGLWIAWKQFRRQTDEHQHVTVLLLTSATGILFLNQVSSRSDLIHLLPAAIFALMTGCLLITGGHMPRQKPLRIIVGLLIVLMFHKPVYTALKNFQLPLQTACAGGTVVKTLDCMSRGKEEKEVVDWVIRNTRVTDTLYVGVTNHDRFRINDAALYFLAQRRPATRYHELHPGVTNTRPVQEEMIAELQQNAPAAIILAENFKAEPNRSAEDSGVDLLDTHIARHYQAVAHAGKYVILTPLSQ